MIPVRTEIELRQGEKVGLLFTPRLYSFKGEQGVDFKGDTTQMSEVYSLYADLFFCAALNYWTLTGNAVEDAPFSRMDFHEFSASQPKAFGKTLDFALKALTGKSLKEFIPSKEKVAESEDKAGNTGGELKKKSSSHWITRLLRRS